MAGNSARRGAVRKSKKGASTGSGGVRRRALEGKGPTPKAEDRPAHKAYKGASAGGSTGRRGPGGGRARARSTAVIRSPAATPCSRHCVRTSRRPS